MPIPFPTPDYEPLQPLGEKVVRPKPTLPPLKHSTPSTPTSPGIVRGPDGKLSTDLPPPKS